MKIQSINEPIMLEIDETKKGEAHGTNSVGQGLRPIYVYVVRARTNRQCMEINVSVQYNGGLLPDIILLTRCSYIGEPF